MIVIKPHRGPRRSGDYIPGLHIHNQRKQGGVSRSDGNDEHPDDLEQHHYPRGRLYTPEIDRLRENLERRKPVPALGDAGSESQHPMGEEGKEPEQAGPDTQKVNCQSDQEKVS